MDEAEKAKYREARTALRRWFYFDHVENFDFADENDMSDEDYEALEDAYKKIMGILCKYAGHVVENDMCGRPEHRYCVECLTLQPNAEVTPRG